MARRAARGLRRRKGIWHIQKQIKGYGRICKSTGTADLDEAERILAIEVEKIRKQIVFGERPEVRFSDAVIKFMHEKAHLRSLDRTALGFAHVLPYIGDLRLEQIHNDSVARYREARRAQGVKAATIDRDLAAVRALLNRAARVWRHSNGMPYLDTPPLIERQHGESRKPFPLQFDEQERLLKELPEHLRDMALFMINTGLRDQELCQLRWEWELRVPEIGVSVFRLPETYTKNEEERVVMLNRVAREVVDRQRGRHAEHVFTYNGKPVSRVLNTSWKRARTRAGLPRLRVHDLRHTFGHRLRAAGVHEEDRKVLLGHKNREITTHYSAPDLRRLQSLVERLADQQEATVVRFRTSQNEAKVRQESGQNAELSTRLVTA
jgi:integrase